MSHLYGTLDQHGRTSHLVSSSGIFSLTSEVLKSTYVSSFQNLSMLGLELGGWSELLAVRVFSLQRI